MVDIITLIDANALPQPRSQVAIDEDVCATF
jgi:hypothetical protein